VFSWLFNPNENDPAFRSFFLEDMAPGSWPSDPASVPPIMLDENDLAADVDVFFGFSLRGEGECTTPDCGRDDLAPERIGWSIVRETPTGDVSVETRYLVHFDCPLSYEETEKPRLLYFRHDLEDMYPEDGEGLFSCLSNCGDMQGWESLGIDNIEENCWDTNSNHLFSGDASNPVLAAYGDGPYRLDVTCYSHEDQAGSYPAVEFS